MNVEGDFHRLVMKAVLDVACLFVVAVPVLLFYLWGKPYQRGFFCDDESLRHPYIDSTVPSWLLYVVGLGLPIAVMVVVEIVIYKRDTSPKHSVRLMSTRVPTWMWESYGNIGIFGFGAACSQLITDIAKYTIGRLRPHFFDVCRPDIDCTNPKYRYLYIENFTCTEKNERLLKEMRLSFPSGHSSFSAYCMIFLVLFLHAKMTWRGSKLLKHVLQFVCLTLAFFTALSRISDYKHHWSDVLAGSTQGFIVAVLIVFYVSELFDKSKTEMTEDYPSPDGIRMENNLSMH